MNEIRSESRIVFQFLAFFLHAHIFCKEMVIISIFLNLNILQKTSGSKRERKLGKTPILLYPCRICRSTSSQLPPLTLRYIDILLTPRPPTNTTHSLPHLLTQKGKGKTSSIAEYRAG